MSDKKIKEIDNRGGNGLYQCFNCLEYAVKWENDFMFDEVGYEGLGIVHYCTCMNCGADIEYRVPLTDEEKDIWESSTKQI